MEKNPFDILLVIVYFGYFLTAILTYYLIDLYRFKGLLIGIATNALIHANVIINGERLAIGYMPTGSDVIRELIFLVGINVLLTFATWFILRFKDRSATMATAIALLISSIFFWNFIIPGVFLLIILTIPIREYKLS